jgi:hypothetical protein
VQESIRKARKANMTMPLMAAACCELFSSGAIVGEADIDDAEAVVDIVVAGAAVTVGTVVGGIVESEESAESVGEGVAESVVRVGLFVCGFALCVEVSVSSLDGGGFAGG